MPASLAIAQCDPAPNISVDWEYNINNDVEDGNDIAYDIEAIDDASDGDSEPDNGYIVVGSTETDDNLKQAWIVRLNPDGTSTGGDSWKKDEGRTANDWAQAVEQVTDDKIVVVGTKRTSTFGSGNNDNVWLLEIDLSDGTVLSEHEYGDVGHDKGYDVKVDPNTGYYVIAAMAGKYKSIYSDDLDDDTLNAEGVYWVLEVAPADNYEIQWDETYFGDYTGSTNSAEVDIARSIVIDEDGRYVVTGSCKSCDPDKWHDEFMTVKIDPSNSYSATEEVDGYPAKDQVGWNIIETDDGGYLTCGITHPSGMPSCLNAHNFHVIKHNSSLGDTWSPGCQLYDGVTFGGNKEDNAYCGVQACDGEFIIVGSTKLKSNEEDVTCNSDDSETTTDGWVLKINSSGVKVWDESFGNDAKDDAIYSIKRLHDGSYIMAGETESNAVPSELQDFYVVKFQLSDCDAPTGLSSPTVECHAYLSWDVVDCVHEYVLRYKKTTASVYTTVDPATSPYTVNGTSGGNNYVWGVRARCSPDQESSWTQGAGFTIGPCRIGAENNNAADFNQLMVYPNPVDEVLRITLQSDIVLTGLASVKLLEPAGRIVNASESIIESGLLELEMAVGALPRGFYFLIVTIDSKSYRAVVAAQ
jgi:hypothetical protein